MRLLQLLRFRRGQADASARPTFFFHIPKCAGTSVWDTLFDIYGTRHVFLVNSKRKRERLANMGLDARLSYGAIGGHGPLPLFRDLLGEMDRHYKIVTLRDPVDRAVSEYNFIRARPTHPRNAALAGLSFEDFAKTPLASNQQVKLLTGKRHDVVSAVEIVQAFFDDWALSGEIGALTNRLYQVTGTTPRPAQHKNAGRSGLRRADVAPTTLRLLEEQNRSDLALIEALKRTRAQ